MALLEVRELSVEARTASGDVFRPVEHSELILDEGRCIGLVGESGSGKSLTLKAIMGLLGKTARVASGEILLDGEPMDPKQARGRDIAMIFQEPMSALNPTMRARDLIAEGPVARGVDRSEARAIALSLMREVGIPDPERRALAWPHELSGGLRQRVMIAMMLAADPRILLCDEPTTALDVTIQDQVLALLDRLRRERNMSMIFVTHDLAVISQLADDVVVMYAGQVVESGPIREVFEHPQHPYTLALLRSLPTVGDERRRLDSIGGSPPGRFDIPPGCRFAPRCHYVQPDCRIADYDLADLGGGRQSQCIHREAIAGEVGVEFP